MNKLIKKVNECLRTYRESPFLIFIDVGAHIGKYSVQFFDKVHKVVAIEPDPNNFALLKINIRLNKAENIIPLQLAAGAVEQYAKLYSSNLLTGRTYITMRDERVKRKKNVEEYIVKVMRVEDILKRLGLMQDNIIYIVKIDVEGYEEKVLKGMSEVLPKTIILMIETSYENFRNVLNLLPRTFYLVASFYYPKTINLIFIQRKMVNAI
ncbi:MAG: FkbM family methyltransferase [Aigarchaeota archaeon]|nr:FkbM family methyltransferase [Aigarchaeota archaeon]MDW7986876.1 FkbM family methyltransferase [Nitrososphaerota archaeon]